MPSLMIERRADRRPHPLAGKYLTFAIDGEEYGVPVLQVREIVKLLPITRVPQVPEHVKGVVNLRGKVVPVVDLRLKLGFGPCECTDRTCIVIVEIHVDGGDALIGLIVDAVSEVATIVSRELQDTPCLGGGIDPSYIKAIAKVKDGVRMLIDLERVLAGDVGTGR